MGRELLEKGTTKLWDEFIGVVPLIKDELSLEEINPIETEVSEKSGSGLDYHLQFDGKVGRITFNVSTHTDSDDVNDWTIIQYSLRITSNDDNESYSKNERFRKKDGPPLPVAGWLMLAFYQRNLRTRPDLSKLLAGQDIRIISLPEYDHHYDFAAMLSGLATSQFSLEVLRFRHVYLDESTGNHDVKVEFSYAIRMNEFWAIFPFLGPVWSYSALQDQKDGEEELQGVKAGISLALSSIDFDKEEFMSFVMRYETTYRDHFDYSSLRVSLDSLLNISHDPQAERKTYYEKEIGKIEDSIWEKDYPHAIRDLRALIEDYSRELLKKNGVSFEEKDELHELKSKMIQNKLVEGRLNSWFEAFAAFGNKSAHENYPTKEQVHESQILRNRTELTILIGKVLLSEILEAISQ